MKRSTTRHRRAALGFAVAALMLPQSASADTLRLPRLEGGPAHILGTGYDTRSREFRDVCVEGDVEHVSQTQGYFDFETALSQERRDLLFAGTIGGEIDVFLASARADVTYRDIRQDEAYTRRLVFGQRANGRFARLVNLRLSPVGQRAAAAKDPEYARLLCGDRVVLDVNLGGSLFVNAGFELSDERARSELEAKITVRFLFISDSKTYRDVKEEVRTNAVLRLDGMQVGGDPAAFQGLLAEARKVQCSLAQPEACGAILQRLLEYATGPNGFRAQVGNLEYRGEASPVESYGVTRYEDIAGLEALRPTPSPIEGPALQEAKAYLGRLWNVTEARRLRAATLLAGHTRPEQRSDWQAFERDAKQNLYHIGNAIDLCFSRPDGCLDEVARLEGALAVLAPERLVRPLTTYDVCRLQAPDLPDQKAIAALARAARIDVSAHDDAQCARLEEALDRAGELDLGRSELTDVRALRGIRGLRRLGLRENHIELLSPIASLADLEELDLTYNDVRTLTPLARLPRLTRLHAGYNRVQRLVGIEAMAALERLSLEGNTLFDSDVLARLPRLRYLSLTEDARCEAERLVLRDQGSIDAATYERYRARNFAPVYERPGLGTGTVTSWVFCPGVARAY